MIVIGDIHGRDTWKEIVGLHPKESVLFIGDYCDSYDILPETILQNLRDIVEFARSSKETGDREVTLLLGNHDVHYWWREDPGYRCSGFHPTYAYSYQQCFLANPELFDLCHYDKASGKIFTHAGITSDTYAYLDLASKKVEEIPTVIKEALASKKDRDFLLRCGRRRGGPSETGGIVWADEREWLVDYPVPLHQVVGHTPQDQIKTYQFIDNPETSITFVDVLGNPGLSLEEKYLQL